MSETSAAVFPGFLVTIPHSGEKIPELTPWLRELPEEILMCDVDRFVDRLYEPALTELNIPYVKTEWHRYAVDLNRIPEDIDGGSVVGEKSPPGTHSRGFHWTVTTYNNTLMSAPMSLETHEKLKQIIYDPFHEAIQKKVQTFFKTGCAKVFHLDVHSMPSLGTKMHRDPGEARADVVISDCGGKSCSASFRDLVIAAYVTAGFRVGYNWPYLGGRVTEQYGAPEQGHEVLQVELNRKLYMDEGTKKILPQHAQIQKQLRQALATIQNRLGK